MVKRSGNNGAEFLCRARGGRGTTFAMVNPSPAEKGPHQSDDHDPDECYECLLREEVISTCRCAECCRRLIIEVGLEDAEREPRIKERGSPIFTPPELTASGERELEGYLLNGKDLACVFLDREKNLCTIHETRPLACRLFDCVRRFTARRNSLQSRDGFGATPVGHTTYQHPKGEGTTACGESIGTMKDTIGVAKK
jgi:Fe-S-cluster containining protein